MRSTRLGREGTRVCRAVPGYVRAPAHQSRSRSPIPRPPTESADRRLGCGHAVADAVYVVEPSGGAVAVGLALPIGRKGSSALYSVKDRYGEVERWGELQSGDGMPWYYMGQFVVDDTRPEDTSGLLPRTEIHLTVPAKNEEGQANDALDILGPQVMEYLKCTTGRFESVRKLGEKLRAKGGFKFSQNDLAPALERLADRGHIEWPEVARGSRPGRLTDMSTNPEGTYA